MHCLGVTRRGVVKGLGLGLAASLVQPWLHGQAAGGTPRNVLFLAVDDLRPELPCYGATHVKAPNLDRLAATGTVFTQAYCQQAVCSPSRTSLLTGLRPDSTRVYDLDTHFRNTVPDVVTLPQHLKAHGYFAQGMSKIYHGGLDDPASWSIPWVGGGKSPQPALPRLNGYYTAENIALLEADEKGAARKRQELRQQLGRPLKHSEASRFQVRGPAYEAPDIPDEQTHDGATALLAVETLRGLQAKGEPFFLAVGFLKPHLPFIAPKRWWDLYDPAAIALAPNPFAPEGAPPWALANSGELRSYRGIPKGREPVPEETARSLKHGYLACVSFLDAQVGRVLTALDQLGLAGNTVVILWGDHGWKLGEHGEWCKHTNYENDTRAPLLLRVPGQAHPGQRCDRLVEFVDVYPTLCDLCGVPLPGHLEGTSFAPLLSEPGRPWKRAVCSQYPRNHQGKALMGYALRDERYRFVEWVSPASPLALAPEGVVELYDHQTDPQEDHNLAAAPALAGVVKEFRALLRAGWKAARPPA